MFLQKGNSMTAERRQFSRYQIKCDATIICDVGQLPVKLTEISVEGVRAEMSKAPAIGTGATITMVLEKEVIIRGVVLWAIEAGTAGLHYFQVGIETDSIQMGEDIATGLGQRTHVIQEVLSFLKTG